MTTPHPQPRGLAPVSRGLLYHLALGERLLTKYAYPGTGDTAFSHGARWTTSVLPVRRETTGPKIAIPPQMTATTSSGLSLARAGSYSIPRHAYPHFKWASGFSHPMQLLYILLSLSLVSVGNIYLVRYLACDKCDLLHGARDGY